MIVFWSLTSLDICICFAHPGYLHSAITEQQTPSYSSKAPLLLLGPSFAWLSPTICRKYAGVLVKYSCVQAAQTSPFKREASWRRWIIISQKCGQKSVGFFVICSLWVPKWIKWHVPSATWHVTWLSDMFPQQPPECYFSMLFDTPD